MEKFYFTFGTEGHPFHGGWAVVYAPDMNVAVSMFKLVHPCKEGGAVNCAGIYSAKAFSKTSMATSGNFGAFAVEEISLSAQILDESRVAYESDFSQH